MSAFFFVVRVDSKEGFVAWYLRGGLTEELVGGADETAEVQKRLSKAETETLFQLVDVDGDSMMDAAELDAFEKHLGLGWEEGKSRDVFNRLDVQGNSKISFQQFYAWSDFAPRMVHVQTWTIATPDTDLGQYR